MKLIADSGSTKTDWRIIDNKGNISQAKSAGLNPYYITSEGIMEELQQNLFPQIDKSRIQEIFFYGSGCSTDEMKTNLTNTLQKVFGQATINVEDDLVGSARALCNHSPGIACIIGTGTNSCLYDGEKIVDNIPPLGYILGDEGSGAYLGKLLVNAYLKREFPPKLAEKFDKQINLSLDSLLDNVYRQPHPNRYLAGFSKFIFRNIKDPFIMKMVYNGFVTFLQKNVFKYENYQQYKVHFTGSVAFYYGNILRQAANDYGITVQNITESPIAGLALYHQNN